MRHSSERILVSHAGNLPRPRSLEQLLELGVHEPDRRAQFERELPAATAWIVEQQVLIGIDIVNDGEFVKAGSYTGYMQERIEGYSTRQADPNLLRKRDDPAARDRNDFPGFYHSGLWRSGGGGERPGFARLGEPSAPVLQNQRVCTGPIKYTAHERIAEDISRLKSGLVDQPVEGFIASLGPLSFGAGARNEYYANEVDYMMAVAQAVREEYRAITGAGLIVQVDEPEFLAGWMFYPSWSVEEYRTHLAFWVEVINHALEGLPQELVRFHSCWGSGHRPHVNDIELKYVADLLVQINAQCYAIEAGNVRHSADYHAWETVRLPEGKMLMPGVVSHATDLVEHPELVAERLVNYANLIGRENVQAGTDCGIGYRVGHEEVAWAKLKTLVAGAEIASQRLWNK